MPDNVVRFWDISWLNESISAKIKAKWGLRRLFRWVDIRMPHHGQHIIFNHIINIGAKEGIEFPKRTISYVKNHMIEE